MNRESILNEINAAKNAALNAVGIEAVGCVVDTMQKYEKPIWRTGDLQRDVNYQVQDDGKSVIIGNSLDYALFVH